MPIHTPSPYSEPKVSADLLVLAYHRPYGMTVSISRCSNSYGTYQFQKMISLMIANCFEEKKFPIYGGGLNVRDWIYENDHCEAIDRIIHSGKARVIYNIGGHNEKANIYVVKFIIKTLGKSEDLIEHVTDRKVHHMRQTIDPTKIHTELGWLSNVPFDQGIKLTIDWYMQDEEWWKKIRNEQQYSFW